VLLGLAESVRFLCSDSKGVSLTDEVGVSVMGGLRELVVDSSLVLIDDEGDLDKEVCVCEWASGTPAAQI